MCRCKLPDDMQESVLQTLSIQALGQVTHFETLTPKSEPCMGFNLFNLIEYHCRELRFN